MKQDQKRVLYFEILGGCILVLLKYKIDLYMKQSLTYDTLSYYGLIRVIYFIILGSLVSMIATPKKFRFGLNVFRLISSVVCLFLLLGQYLFYPVLPNILIENMNNIQVLLSAFLGVNLTQGLLFNNDQHEWNILENKIWMGRILKILCEWYILFRRRMIY